MFEFNDEIKWNWAAAAVAVVVAIAVEATAPRVLKETQHITTYYKTTIKEVSIYFRYFFYIFFNF